MIQTIIQNINFILNSIDNLLKLKKENKSDLLIVHILYSLNGYLIERLNINTSKKKGIHYQLILHNAKPYIHILCYIWDQLCKSKSL